MIEKTKSVKKVGVVGTYIRQQREKLNLSQRELGQLFTPPVTTQFISNVERGVTPLPPNHIPTLAQALKVNEAELQSVLEKEYAAKLNGRLGRAGEVDTVVSPAISLQNMVGSSTDLELMKKIYDAYRSSDPQTRNAFITACESVLKISRV